MKEPDLSSAVGRALSHDRHKRRRKAVSATFASVLCVIFLLGSLLPGLPAQAAPEDGYQWDLRNFTTDVIITDGEGNVVPDDGTGIVMCGDIYYIEINFDSFKASDFGFLFEYKSDDPYMGTLVYQLPEGISIPDSFIAGSPHYMPGPAYWSPGIDIGEFDITEDGLVLVRFYDLDVDGKPSIYNLLVNDPLLKFWIKLETVFDGDDGLHTFEFGDGIDIDLTLTSPPPALDVEKVSHGYDPETESVAYSIKITAHNGDISDIVVEDQARINPSFDTWWLDVSGSLYEVAAVSSTDDSWPAGGFSPETTETGLKFDFADLTLHDGESIFIDYTIHAGELLAAFWSEKADEGWADYRDYVYNFDIFNGVSVFGTDMDGFPVTPELETETTPVQVYWPLSKAMDGTGNLATFSLIVNPESLKLNPDTPDDVVGRITLTDRMCNMLAFYLSSVAVWELKPGMTVDDPDCWQLLDPGEWSRAVTAENEEYTEVTFDLPDKTPLRITYNALVKGEAETSVDVSNYVTVTGGYHTTLTDSFYIQSITSGPEIGTGRVMLSKGDSQSSTALEDAWFALYLGEAYSGWMSVVPPLGVPQTITVEGVTFYYLLNTSMHTDKNGQCIFTHAFLRVPDRVFAIYEIMAPPGYNLPDERATLFYFKDPGTDEGDAPAVGSATVVPVETDYLYIGNSPSEVVISGTKMVSGVDAPEKLFTFHLVQVKNAYGKPMKNPITREATVEADGEGSFDFAFEPIYRLRAGVYYFEVTESGGEESKYWTYDGAKYIVMVEITDSDGKLVCTVTDVHGDPVDIEFMNEYHRPSGSLKISKFVDGRPDGAPFTFTVKAGGGGIIDLSAPGISVALTSGTGTYEPVDLPNGVFSITHDTEITISGLPPGDYTITELASGYAITYTIDGVPGGATQWNQGETGLITVVEDGVSEVAFTNAKYTPVLPETGGIGKDKLHTAAAVLLFTAAILIVGCKVLRRRGQRRYLFKRE